MAELEHELRAALAERAAEVSESRLRHAHGPRTSPARRPVHVSLVAPLTAAVVVALIAIAIGIASRSGSSHPVRVQAGSPAPSARSFGGDQLPAGTRWRLVSVTDDGTTFRIPVRAAAGIALDSGHITMSIQHNIYMHDTYHRTADGMIIGDHTGPRSNLRSIDPAIEPAVKGLFALAGPVSTIQTPSELIVHTGPDTGSLTLTFVMDTTDDIDPTFAPPTPHATTP